MFYVILLVLAVLFYIWLERILRGSLSADKAALGESAAALEALLEKESALRKDNQRFSQHADSVIEMYEVTKDVCKEMEEDKVFAVFEEKLRRYISAGRIKLIKQDFDYELYKDDLVYPLDIGIKPTFFLVAQGVPAQQQDKFYILAQQFLLGFRRAVLYRKVQDLAIRDSLTGILTRRYFLERAEEEIRRAKKFNLNFSFLMIDIDHFKQCNDRYGHLVGDAALREIAAVIKDNSREIDIVGRYGGEEFSVILAETPRQGALVACQRILKNVGEKKIKAYDEELSLTVSVGIACFPEDAEFVSELMDKSDLALYQAKHSGRNKVCVYGG